MTSVLFTLGRWDHHSSGTVLQLCLYSQLLKVDGAPAPEPTWLGLGLTLSLTLTQVRPRPSLPAS